MSPAARSRRTTSKASRTQRAGAAARDRGPSLAAVFNTALRAARGLAAATDPLEAETFASGIVGSWRVDLVGESDPAVFFGERLVRHLVGARSPDALALLHALAAVAPAPVAEQALFATRRLRAGGLPDPPWASQVGRARFVEAWISSDEYGDQDFIVASFEHVGCPPHAVVLMLDHNFHGLIRSAFVAPDPPRVVATWADTSGMPIAPLAAQRFADVLANGLHMYDVYLDPPVNDGVRELVALLRSRLRALPTPAEIDIPEVPERRRRQLLAAFRRSPEAAGLAEPDLAHDFIAFACDYGAGDPLRWSPIAIEICLLDWFPRKVTMDDEMARNVPDVMRRWVRYAAGQKGLSDGSIAESLAAIDEFEPQFREAMADPSNFGPAKAMAHEMLADGIDLSDGAAIQRWIDAANARRQD